jgi:hypothetical protein
MSEPGTNCNAVGINGLPEKFPTHGHDGAFWESLGRAVATFSFLEEALRKATLAFTATRPIEESEIEMAYKDWRRKLQKTLSDPLGPQIISYGDAMRDHPKAGITKNELENLLQRLRKVAEMRNILCHGSWWEPDGAGVSVIHFASRKNEIHETPIDVTYLNQVQRHTASLICLVWNTMADTGFQFPGMGSQVGPIQRDPRT